MDQRSHDPNAGPGNENAPPPHLDLVHEVIRHLSIAEKNTRLYPSYSKIGKECIEGLHQAIVAFCEEFEDPLFLKVTQEVLEYCDTVVYEEEVRGRSIAFRLYKDGVRGIVFHPDLVPEDVSKFLICFKELANTDEEDDDFGTLYWEKDCNRILLHLIDETEAAEEEFLPIIPGGEDFLRAIEHDRFNLEPAEEQRLRELLQDQHTKDEEGESTFELTEEEQKQVLDLATAEKEYFAIYDFLDVLLELVILETSSKSFKDALNLIQNILTGLVENLDFGHAASVLGKLTQGAHPGLTRDHLRDIRKVVEEFCHGDVINLIGNFLEESDKLPKEHPVFSFLQAMSPSTLPKICEFLRHHKQQAGMSPTLIALGKGQGNTLARYLKDPDPQVASAMIPIVLASQPRDFAIEKVCDAVVHDDAAVRETALKVLLQLGDPKVGAHLIPLLKSPNRKLLHSALQFFGKFPCERAYPTLVELLRSKLFLDLDRSERALAFHGLIQANRGPAMAFVKKLLSVRFCITRRAAALRAAALFALAQTDPVSATEFAERFAQQKRGPMREPARQTLLLIEKMRRQDEEEAKRPQEVQHV